MSHPSNDRLGELLKKCPQCELDPLYDVIGDSITGKAKDVEELVNDLRKWGSNTFVTWLIRFGDGVSYQEVTQDVASFLQADVTSCKDETDYETAILAKVLEKYLEKASPEERDKVNEILDQARRDAGAFGKHASGVTAAGGLALSSLITILGREAAKRVIGQIVKQVITRVIARQAAQQSAKVAARVAGLAIPLINVAFAIWLAIDIAGPAYRKTVPAVIRIALLRQEYAD